MSRDPFQHLRESNPMPEDRPVYPPMSTADRIAGGAPRRSWPAWALAGAVALAVLVGGGSWLLWLRGGNQDVAATTLAPTTTTVAPTTTVVPGFPEDDAVVYFFVEDDGTQNMPGPYLIPVARPYAVLSHMVEDPVYETLNFLLVGTYPGEEDDLPALLSYIPEGTRLLGVDVDDRGIATVDLSPEFMGGGANRDVILDPAAVRRGLAQIVYTLARFPGISSIRFLVDGGELALPGEDWMTGRAAATRADFADLLPPIMIESPVYWASGGDNPLLVDGTADVFEAVVSLELLDQDGAVLWEGTAMATCGTGCRGGFSVDIPYEVAEGQIGTLVAWEASAEDGSRLNVREHPVWLNATPGVTTTTDPVTALLAERYDLDKALDAYLEELAAIDAQLAGLPLDQGTELRTRAAELDQQVSEMRDGLSRVFDELRALEADFEIPCSADELDSAFVEQPELPDPVEDIRHAVFDGARACNWEALRGLLDEGTFSYSFGEDGDPAGFWQRMEFLHYEPMLYIAGMLQRPFGVVESDGLPIYAWPSAHAYASWAEVPEAEKEALRPLYGDLDFGFFGEFGGYLGYRVGITLDGDWAQWIYAISGD